MSVPELTPAGSAAAATPHPLRVAMWCRLPIIWGGLSADDEHFAGGFDGVGGDGVQVVDLYDVGDLAHEAFDEAEVAAGDSGDGDDGFGVGRPVGVVAEAEFLPVPGEILRNVCRVQGSVLMGKPTRL